MTDTRYCPITARGLIAFEGPDTRSFLHGQLTCEVAALPADTSTYGAYCTPKGRVLATFLLWGIAEGCILQLPQALREPIQKRLSMYILRSKVKASDAGPDRLQYGLAGPQAPALVQRLAGHAPAAMHEVAHGARGAAIRLPRDRYLVVVPRAAEDAALAVLAEAQRESETWWDALDIEAAVPNVLPETQEQFVPQMLNLDALGAVSFGKGCYPGQEIVARMHYLGRVKERTVRGRIAADARPGDKLYGADLGTQAAGMIANATPSAEGGSDVLAVVQLSSLAAGPVRLGADGPELAIGELPYALPAK